MIQRSTEYYSYFYYSSTWMPPFSYTDSLLFREKNKTSITQVGNWDRVQDTQTHTRNLWLSRNLHSYLLNPSPVLQPQDRDFTNLSESSAIRCFMYKIVKSQFQSCTSVRAERYGSCSHSSQHWYVHSKGKLKPSCKLIRLMLPNKIEKYWL